MSEKKALAPTPPAIEFDGGLDYGTYIAGLAIDPQMIENHRRWVEEVAADDAVLELGDALNTCQKK
jgi:hypothetical protein